MSLDPETRRQILELARDDRPLLVLDVDEVVLEFVAPLIGFLDSQGLHLKTDTFRLHGNVVSKLDQSVIEDHRVSALLEDFFGVQDAWQVMASDAPEVVGRIAGRAEVVMLTAMPHRHRDRRRRFLDELGFTYPMLTTEGAKGPAIALLRGETDRPVAFVDDIVHNLISVRDAVPDATLVHLMAHQGLRSLLPALPPGIIAAADWNDAEQHLTKALGI